MGWSHRQIRPAKVFEAATNRINIKLGQTSIPEPAWYKAVQAIPPAESIVRTLPVRHSPPAAATKRRKPKKVFRPQKIQYVEDTLRSTFFKDHPWELARPRILVEKDGKDAQRYDWSRGLRQAGLPLCGECVVQRQLWLMETQGMERDAAYDRTRHEFYRLRQEEQVEQRMALEEARYVGAYFGLNRLEVGMQLEDREFEAWKIWAAEEVDKAAAKKNAMVETFGEEDNDDAPDFDLPPEELEQEPQQEQSR